MAVDRFTKVCVKCQVEMRVKQNGVVLVEAATWGMLTLRQADLWHCPACGFEAVLGCADRSFYQCGEGDIEVEIKRLEARGERVIVCWLNAAERDHFKRRRKEEAEKAALGL